MIFWFLALAMEWKTRSLTKDQSKGHSLSSLLLAPYYFLFYYVWWSHASSNAENAAEKVSIYFIRSKLSSNDPLNWPHNDPKWLSNFYRSLLLCNVRLESRWGRGRISRSIQSWKTESANGWLRISSSAHAKILPVAPTLGSIMRSTWNIYWRHVCLYKTTVYNSSVIGKYSQTTIKIFLLRNCYVTTK